MDRTSLCLTRQLHCNNNIALISGSPSSPPILSQSEHYLEIVCPYRAVPLPGCSPMEDRQQRKLPKVIIGMVIPDPACSVLFVSTLTRHRCTAEMSSGFSITWLFLLPDCRKFFMLLHFFLPLASGREQRDSGPPLIILLPACIPISMGTPKNSNHLERCL